MARAKAARKAPERRQRRVRRKQLKVEYMPLSALEKWPRNPKLHDLDGIKGSIRRFGFTVPVVIDEGTRRLIAGHGRQDALSSMKEAGEVPPKNIIRKDSDWLVPVVRGNEFESEAEAERYLIADNRFVELGGWDPALLSTMLGDFDGPDLRSVGFDEQELARITAAAEGEGEVPKKIVSFAAKNANTTHKCPNCGHRWSE